MNSVDTILAQKPASIPTNLRALQVLEVIAAKGVPLIPSDVETDLGLPKATVHRLFQTLEAEGYLQRDIDGRSYAPGTRLRNLSLQTLSSIRIRNARLAILGSLARKIGETCNVAVADRSEMIYLDRVETEWPLRIQLPIGSRVPLHSTASGKLYLSTLTNPHLDRYLANSDLPANTGHTITSALTLRAELEAIRSQGFALDREEFIEGMVALAVGIKDNQGRVAATLSFHAPIMRMAAEQLEAHLPLLETAADEMSMLMTSD